MTAIYKRHLTGLGISYSAFRKLVRRHANDFRPGHREPAPTLSDPSRRAPNRSDTLAPATTLPSTPQDGRPSHAAYEQYRGSFRYSPIAKEGEIDQLFGSGFFAGKK
jgi:hypothetical protein